MQDNLILNWCFVLRIHSSYSYAEAGVKLLNSAINFFSEDELKFWPRLFPLLVIALNSRPQKHGLSAVQLLYGRTFNHIPGSMSSLVATDTNMTEFLKNRLSQRAAVLQRKFKLRASQKRTFDRNRRDVTFVRGEIVLIYSKPYRNRAKPINFLPRYRKAQILRKISNVMYLVRKIYDNKPPKNVRFIFLR